MYKVLIFIVLQVNLLSVMAQNKNKRHVVSRIDGPTQIDANWEKSTWSNIDPIVLENYMGEKPEHFPRVQAKVAYDS